MSKAPFKQLRRTVGAASLIAAAASAFSSPASADTVGGEPAPAPADCYGDWCSGVNPMETPCAADAVTVAWADYVDRGSRLEVRWSPSCKTNWAKFIVYPQGLCWGCNGFTALLAEQSTGYTQSTDLFAPDPAYTLSSDGITTFWTPMIYSPELGVRARLLPGCSSTTLVGCAFDMATESQHATDYV